MTLLRKAGSGSVDPVIFNDVVDAEQNGSGGVVTAADIDSQAAANGDVLTADGAGNAAWEPNAGSTFATPAVALGASAVAGSASTVIRSDATIVAFDSTAPTTQAFADAASVGTAAVAARRDHKHAMPAAPTSVSGNAGTATALATSRNIDGQGFDGTANITVIAPGTHAATSKNPPVDADEIPLVDSAASNVLKKLTWANLKATIKAYTDTLYPSGSGTSSGTNTGDVAFATNAVVLGTAAAAGAASTVMRSNDTIAAFDATSPSTQAIGDAAAVGVATVAARRDHKHAMPAFATNAVVLGSSAAAGSAATLIHSDDTIAAFDATAPTTQAFGDSAVVGTAAFAARRDHKHAFPALGTGSTNACAGNDSRLSDARTPTAGSVGGVIWTTVTKGSDTSRSSTTTTAADPALTFTPSAGIVEVQAIVIYGNPLSAGTPDIKAVIAEDATARGVLLGLGPNAADTNTLVAYSANTSGTSWGTAAANRALMIWGNFIATGAAVSVWWAQGTSDGNPTVVRTGSVLRWRQII